MEVALKTFTCVNCSFTYSNCTFTKKKFSFLFFCFIIIVSLTPFIHKPDSSRDLIIFMISYISSLEIINVVKADLKTFLWIVPSIAGAAAVNPNGFKTLLANGFSTFPIKENPVFRNIPKSLPKNPPDCPIFCNWVLDNFLTADEPYAKALRIFETWDFWKLVSSLELLIIFDEGFKVSNCKYFIRFDWNFFLIFYYALEVPFFITDFDLLSCKLDNFAFIKGYIESIFILKKKIKLEHFYNFLWKI